MRKGTLLAGLALLGCNGGGGTPSTTPPVDDTGVGRDARDAAADAAPTDGGDGNADADAGEAEDAAADRDVDAAQDVEGDAGDLPAPYPFTVGVGPVADVAALASVAHEALSGARTVPVSWGEVEPVEPAEPGVHRYDWAAPDRLVRAAAASGLSDLVIVLRCASPWGAVAPAPGAVGGTPPGPGPERDPDRYWSLYAAWVEAAGERYDGDGVDDMPGLARPVRRFQVESGLVAGRGWLGDEAAADAAPHYTRLLAVAARSLRRADAQAVVVLAGVGLGDALDDFPDNTLLLARLESDAGVAAATARLQAALGRCGDFDEVALEVDRGHAGVATGLAHLRALLAQAGCPERPIVVHATSVPDLAPGYAGARAARPPATFVSFLPRSQGMDVLDALAEPGHADHAEAAAWVRALQAREVVKRVAVAAGAGAAGAVIQTVVDDAEAPAWAVRHLGLVEGSAPRPALDALRALLDRVAGFTAVTRLDLADQDPSRQTRHSDVYAYRLDTPRGPAWVAWFDRVIEPDPVDPREPAPRLANTTPTGRGPGAEWPSLAVRLPVGDLAEVDVVEVGGADGPLPDASRRSSPDGVLAVELSTVPLLVTPATP